MDPSDPFAGPLQPDPFPVDLHAGDAVDGGLEGAHPSGRGASPDHAQRWFSAPERELFGPWEISLSEVRHKERKSLEKRKEKQPSSGG